MYIESQSQLIVSSDIPTLISVQKLVALTYHSSGTILYQSQRYLADQRW